MISNIDSPGKGSHSNLQEPNEPNLTIPDYRTLGPDQWALLKRQVARRAHAERAKVVRDIFAALVSWRRKLANRPSRTGARPAQQTSIQPRVIPQ